MNLVETSALVRKIIAGVITIATLYIVFLMTAPIIKLMVYSVFPPKDLPNPIFGKLTPLSFVEKQISTTKPKFELNTKNGKLPKINIKNMPVFKYKEQKFSYSAGRDAQTHAKILGFTEDELISDLKGTVYKWKDKATGGVLEINTNTQELTLNTPLFGKENLLSRGNITHLNAPTIAKNQLTTLGRLTDPLYKKGNQLTTLAKITNGQAVYTDRASEAQLARVDFFRKINNYPIVTEDFTTGLINITIAAPKTVNESLNSLQINYHQWEFEPSQETGQATYPIISITQAWNAVAKENSGVIVNLQPIGKSIFSEYEKQRVDQILINDIFLAYYETVEKQDFLQPIYVFQGTYNVGNKPGGNITIYFPAIVGEYVSEPNL